MCYNEIGTLEKVVLDVMDVMNKLADEYEIIIVDDGSTDGSSDKAMEISRKYPNVKVILHEGNMGIGMVLRDGYFSASYENVVAVPADGQFDVNELLKVSHVPPRTVISFYRTSTPYKSFFRNLMTFINNTVINRWLLGIKIKDVNWVKIYKTHDLKKLNLKMKSVLISSEICAKFSILGYKFLEYESKYLKRVYGEEKGTSLKNVLLSAMETLKLIILIIHFRLFERRKFS